MNTLYKHDKYLNKDIEYLIGNEIIEYDIKEAGFNIIKCFNLLNQEEIDRLDKMTKKQRKIEIGLLQNRHKDLKERLKGGFVECRRIFFTANNLQEDDILSIKKDAIFLLKPCTHTKFKNIIFAEKNRYTSYYHLNNLEFYYNEDKIDVKGINDKLLELHKDGFLLFLKDLFRYKETEDDLMTLKFIKEFSDEYKKYLLPVEFYRELSKDSMYKFKKKLLNDNIYIRDISDLYAEELIDIHYNFIHYIVPFMKILI